MGTEFEKFMKASRALGVLETAPESSPEVAENAADRRKPVDIAAITVEINNAQFEIDRRARAAILNNTIKLGL